MVNLNLSMNIFPNSCVLFIKQQDITIFHIYHIRFSVKTKKYCMRNSYIYVVFITCEIETIATK